MRARQRAVVGLVDLPANIGGAKRRLRRQGGFRVVLPHPAVEQLGRFRGSLGRMRLRRLGLQIGSRAEQQQIPLWSLGTDDALVADPAGAGLPLGLWVGELRLVVRILFLQVGVGKDADPWAVSLVDDDLVTGRYAGNRRIRRLGRGVHAGVVDHRRAAGEIGGLALRILTELAGGRQTGNEEECDKERKAHGA